MKKFKLLCSLAIFLLLLMVMAISTIRAEEPVKYYGPVDEVKAAVLIWGPKGGSGWAYSHWVECEEIEKLPFAKLTRIENVSVPDSPRVMQELIRKGHNMIFTAAFDFMETTAEMANKFPDVVFESCSGYLLSENMGNYYSRTYEAAFLGGMLAGAMTKSNIVGYVAAYPIPVVIRDVNAFALGVKETNPDARVHLVWVNSWYDPGKAREAAESLIAIKADVLGQYQNDPTVVQTAEKHGIYGVGAYTDMSKFAPKSVLTSVLFKWSAFYKYLPTIYHEGKWKSEPLLWGLRKGGTDISPIGPMVPEDVKKKVLARRKRMLDGDETALPFYGPINDQAGQIMVPAGQDISDQDLVGMTWLVDNIVGTVPKAE